jgi:hypothetical protein
MFAHGAALWQTAAAKRGDNRFNGLLRASIGTIGSEPSNQKKLEPLTIHATNPPHKYFALDCIRLLRHTGIASKTICAAGSAKPMFADQP